MTPICKIKTPFNEKFGIPRQSLLVLEAEGILEFPKNDFYSEAFRGISNFSHLWLIFKFNLIDEGHAKALVRPPRFGGKEKVGVFATRSPHRPNRIGLSLVKFKSIEILDSRIRLVVQGVDLVDGTPIIDIKPYLPYVESVSHAISLGFEEAPQKKEVLWKCKKPESFELIQKVLELDPRPQHEKVDKEYGVSIAGLNVKFRYSNNQFIIEKIETKEME
jgi:tRNA-Thr(GGU) m(6)t(6)A37 methyltransferase TsaA